MEKMTLARALTLRKQLQDRLQQLEYMKTKTVVRPIVERVRAEEGVDSVLAKVPLVRPADVMAEYNHYAQQLRLVDDAIQHANHTIEVDVPETCAKEYDWQPVDDQYARDDAAESRVDQAMHRLNRRT